MGDVTSGPDEAAPGDPLSTARATLARLHAEGRIIGEPMRPAAPREVDIDDAVTAYTAGRVEVGELVEHVVDARREAAASGDAGRDGGNLRTCVVDALLIRCDLLESDSLLREDRHLWDTYWEDGEGLPLTAGETADVVMPVLAEVTAERDHYKRAATTTAAQVEQILGMALGYPAMDDGVSVCVGDHVPESLAVAAAVLIGEQGGEIKRLQAAALDSARTALTGHPRPEAEPLTEVEWTGFREAMGRDQ